MQQACNFSIKTQSQFYLPKTGWMVYSKHNLRLKKVKEIVHTGAVSCRRLKWVVVGLASSSSSASIASVAGPVVHARLFSGRTFAAGRSHIRHRRCHFAKLEVSFAILRDFVSSKLYRWKEPKQNVQRTHKSQLHNSEMRNVVVNEPQLKFTWSCLKSKMPFGKKLVFHLKKQF